MFPLRRPANVTLIPVSLQEPEKEETEVLSMIKKESLNPIEKPKKDDIVVVEKEFSKNILEIRICFLID
jgi:hypothetical protein